MKRAPAFISLPEEETERGCGADVLVHVRERGGLRQRSAASIRSGLGAVFLSKRPGPPRSNSASRASRTGAGDVSRGLQRENIGITARRYVGWEPLQNHPGSSDMNKKPDFIQGWPISMRR